MRIIHLLVIAALVFAAAYVYRIKMDSTSRTERVLRLHADIREQRDAIAPVTQYERQLGRLAFLAPELQRRILAGDQPRDLTLRAILKNEMPLAWADQTAWLERISRT